MSGFKFPEAILAQINECSKGGFILFTLNDEGEPIVHSCFDNSTTALALQYYAKNWTEVIDELNNKATFSNIASLLDQEFEEEEADPEEDEEGLI
jgi:hypothetical protein